MFSVDHSTVNLELAESIIDLCGRKLLAPSHHRMSEPETMTFIISGDGDGDIQVYVSG